MFEFDRDFDLEIGSSMIKRRSNKFVLIWKLQEHEGRIGIVGGISSSPVRYKNLVIFGCADHYVYALDINTGKMAWKFRAGQMFVDARPIEDDGIIYIGSFDGHLYALEAESGKELWRFRTGGGIYGSCLVNEGRLYFGSQDSYVYAVDTTTGKEIWRFKTGAEVGSAPTIHEGVLYIGSYDGNLYALAPETGKELWRFKTGGNISNPLSYFVEGNVLYIGCTDGNIYAIYLENGREKWRFKTGSWILASPKPVGDFIYFVSSDGNMYCIDKDGKLVWKFMTDACMDGSPEVVVEKGILYYSSSNGNLYALYAKSGKEIWRFKTDGEIISCPLLHEGKLYFGSFDCHFYCIDIKGKEIWRFKTSSGIKWHAPPESEWFEVEVKETGEELAKEYGSVNLTQPEAMESEYSFRSEYRFKSEYHTKSEYR
jgi:outer membrane protein assembly factor BamB